MQAAGILIGGERREQGLRAGIVVGIIERLPLVLFTLRALRQLSGLTP